MKKTVVFLCLVRISIINYGQIIDHNCTNLQGIPVSYIDQARASLHIAYEHTSHGSQIIDGMTGLYNWKGNTFKWNNGGLNGGLDINDQGITGGSDLGSPDWTSWAASTRSYLKNSVNSDVNVVMWAWCGEVSSATESNINTYLSLMASLESEFPKIKFVYMTGHLDGTGVSGMLHTRNQQIRNYCRDNNKILYDFADIESYDPDGSYYLDKCANDNCDYDSNGDSVRDKNWATIWQNTHTINVDWYNCSSAHSQPLNANRKAYAAWYLFARLAGWNGLPSTVPVTAITVTGNNGTSTISTDNGNLQLTTTVLPTNATNQTIIWSITNTTGTAVISSSGLVTAETDGIVVAKATAADGSGLSGTLSITISNQVILVENIIISTESGINIIPEIKSTLQLNAQVSPTIATVKTVNWSVENITGQATISPAGLVTAIDEGTVTVTATANDGTGINGTIEIAIKSKKNEPLYAIILGSEIRISLDEIYSGSKVSLYDLYGRLISSQPAKDTICTFEASAFKPGIYIIVLSNSVILRVGKFVLPG